MRQKRACSNFRDRFGFELGRGLDAATESILFIISKLQAQSDKAGVIYFSAEESSTKVTCL